MTSIQSIFTAHPEFHVDLDYLSKFGKSWLTEQTDYEKLIKIARQCGVSNRYFAIDPTQILDLSGLRERSQVYQENGRRLLADTVKPALSKLADEKKVPTLFICTSCSVPTIPSIDSQVIHDCNMSSSTTRLPIFQHGCAGGVVGLNLGAKYCQAAQQPVLVSSLELCSLVFQPTSNASVDMLAACLFADGAATVLLSPEPGNFEIVDSYSYLVPDTNELMGYNILDDGLHLRLDRALPTTLLEQLPKLIDLFLKKHDLTTNSINYWLIHPGGKKILDNIRECFSLKMDQCKWSYQILNDRGNMSSATIMYVLKEYLLSPPKVSGYSLILGIGPGLTIELVLCKNN